MKFLDSSGLSTVISYIKKHVPLLNDNNKIPASYIDGVTVPTVVYKNIYPIYYNLDKILESSIAVKSSSNTGFIVTNYAQSLVAFVMISINSNGEIAKFILKPIIATDSILNTYINNKAICLIKTTNGWVLNIKGVVAGGSYIRPMGDTIASSTDLVLNLRQVTSSSTGTVVVPTVTP